MLLNIIKVSAITLTLLSVFLVIYAIVTSAYSNLTFWAVYFAVVVVDLILIQYMKKLSE